jgi:ribonuclease BN (tRNA processing enzyme)
MQRRDFVLTAAALSLPFGRRRAPTAVARLRLVLLGTAGGPRPRKTRAAPAQALILDDQVIVVDCGNGVARQLVLAGVALRGIRHVLITHMHSDHDADYGTLLELGWSSGMQSRVDCWGPPTLTRKTAEYFAMKADEIELRVRDEGRAPLAPLIHAHDVSAGGVIWQDASLKITAAIVDHPPVVPSLAYRFDGPDRSIVISGDTRPSDNLVTLARGADILVHEAMYPEAVDRLVASVANASTLKASILSHHTSAEDAGQIAQRAGVGTLVLSHLIPAEDPLVTDEMWIGAARRHFTGRIVLGTDLLEL